MKPPVIKKAEEGFVMQIPQCCREGWDECPHVAKKEKVKKKRNIAL